jgi:hypothetical protein
VQIVSKWRKVSPWEFSWCTTCIFLKIFIPWYVHHNLYLSYENSGGGIKEYHGKNLFLPPVFNQTLVDGLSLEEFNFGTWFFLDDSEGAGGGGGRVNERKFKKKLETVEQVRPAYSRLITTRPEIENYDKGPWNAEAAGIREETICEIWASLTAVEVPWRWRQYVSPKLWWLPASPHGLTTHNIDDWL